VDFVQFRDKRKRASDCPDALTKVRCDSPTLDNWRFAWSSDSNGKGGNIWTYRLYGEDQGVSMSCRWDRVGSRSSTNINPWLHPGQPGPPLPRRTRTTWFGARARRTRYAGSGRASTMATSMRRSLVGGTCGSLHQWDMCGFCSNRQKCSGQRLPRYVDECSM